jgi:hypothetical protein
MNIAGMLVFSEVLNGMKDPPGALQEPNERRVCYTEVAFKAD